jgi:hypothetical protein
MRKPHHVFLWLAFLLVMIGDSWGQSQRPSPSAGKSIEPPHAQTTQPNKDPAADQRGTEQSPVVVKILPATESAGRTAAEARREDQKTANDDRIARFTERLFWATVALSVIALFQFLAFLWQGWQLQRTVTLARAEFVATHRPRLVVRFVNLIEEGEKRKRAIEFTVVNVGLSNASIRGSSVNAEFLVLRETRNPHTYPQNDLIAPRRFVPGATDRYTFTTIELVNADINELQLGVNSMYLRFYGYIVYEDDMGNSRTTFFARNYNVLSESFGAVDDPDYDNSD